METDSYICVHMDYMVCVQLELLSLLILQVRLCRAQESQQPDPAVLGGEEHHAVRGELDHAGGQGKDPLTCRLWEAALANNLDRCL